MGQVVELPGRRRKAPIAVNGKVPPRRRTHRTVRSREYLTPDEVVQLVAAAPASGRHRSRDQTLLTLMYRHGLRVSEAVSLRWDQVGGQASKLSGRSHAYIVEGIEQNCSGINKKARESPPGPSFRTVEPRGFTCPCRPCRHRPSTGGRARPSRSGRRIHRLRRCSRSYPCRRGPFYTSGARPTKVSLFSARLKNISQRSQGT